MSSYEVNLEAAKIIKEILDAEITLSKDDAIVFELLQEPTNHSSFQRIFEYYLKMGKNLNGN